MAGGRDRLSRVTRDRRSIFGTAGFQSSARPCTPTFPPPKGSQVQGTSTSPPTPHTDLPFSPLRRRRRVFASSCLASSALPVSPTASPFPCDTPLHSTPPVDSSSDSGGVKSGTIDKTLSTFGSQDEERHQNSIKSISIHRGTQSARWKVTMLLVDQAITYIGQLLRSR